MATPKVSNRYPRPGERIAPKTLRDFLMAPLPKQFWKDENDADLWLCDLDETAWDNYSADEIQELSRVIVERMTVYHVRRTFKRRHLPRPPRGIRLEDLCLENRTRRCLAKAGFEDKLGTLADHTLSQIMAIQAFGPRCLVDLLAALESPRLGRSVQGDGKITEVGLSEELTAAAKRLGEVPGAELICVEDPRFGPLIRAIDAEARTARDLAQRVADRVRDPIDPASSAQHAAELIARIEAMPTLTVEEELIEIFASTPYERNRKILIGYYGWEDAKQHTLTEIGQQFGITRERIRQVCAKLTRKHKDIDRILAPVMDRTLAMIEKKLPASAAKLEAELVETGLTKIGIRLGSIAVGAKLLERPIGFKVVKIDTGGTGRESVASRLAARPDQVAPTLAITDMAKKETYFHGLGTVEKIDAMISEKFPECVSSKLVTETLSLIDGFAWLDKRAGWFRLMPIAKHGLPKVLDKILSVAESVTVSDMRTAMSRNRRLWEEPPPENVLLEYCRQTPGIRVKGRRISSDPPRDWRTCLTGVELQLVEVLREHGPVMERGQMEDLCVAAGMNRFSFHAFVSWSPVVAQFGHSVYGLLGAKVTQRQVDLLMAERRAKRLAHRVLDKHGMTEDGRVWLAYRLSKAASTYAVITIPAALKKSVRGRFKLLDPDGRQIGTLATKDGRAWGLGAFMRENDAQIGDYVVVTLDLKKSTAEVALSELPE